MTIRSRTGGLALALAALVLLSPSWAEAQDMAVTLDVVEPPAEAEDPAGGEGGDGESETEGEEDGEGETTSAPRFRAQIDIARPGLTAEELVLKDLDANPPAEAEAAELTPYRESDQPMALVVLVQGNFRWMGNEMYTDRNDPEAGTVYDGAFRGLGPAIDALAGAGPPGSNAALYVYADGKAVEKQPMGDASELSGAALGSQQDYADVISKPFVVGLGEAWKVLARQSDHRKVLVVVGDGNDDKADIGAELRRTIEKLEQIDAEVYTIHYVPVMEDGAQGQKNMRELGYTGHFAATSRDNFRSFADTIVEQIGARYFAMFPGEPFTFDGETHEMVVDVAGRESGPKPIDLPVWEPPKPEEGGSLWWLWLLLALVAVAIIVVVVVLVVKKRRERPPVVAPPPTVQPAPQRTVMLGAGGNEDSMPIVGWVVPLSGPNQYQTFKLLQGGTRFGTGGEAHVLIQDQFMSTEHAEIVASPGGFILNDLGSTNGTFVNQAQVQKHELVDNDTFTLGRTEFKFKSIN